MLYDIEIISVDLMPRQRPPLHSVRLKPHATHQEFPNWETDNNNNNNNNNNDDDEGPSVEVCNHGVSVQNRKSLVPSESR